MNEHHHEHLSVITYFMNDEVEQTHAHRLKAAVMLQQAGFSSTDYDLFREKPREKFASDDEVEIHEGERFEALHRGPTPTS